MRASALVLLALVGCNNDYKLNESPAEPLSLTVTSPEYASFWGDAPVTVNGVVSPTDALVKVNGERATVDPETGAFTTTVPFPAGDRALMVDVRAVDEDETARVLVPVFDGVDPRAADPGALTAIVTPSGLDAVEPAIEALIDGLGWEDQILAVLPAVDTQYVDLVPASVTSAGADVDLSPDDGAVNVVATLNDVQMTVDVVLFDTWSFPVAVTLGEILVGMDAAITVDDGGMLYLSLADAVADIGDIGLSFGSLEIPDEWMAVLADPIAGLVAQLGAALVNVLLEQLGEVQLGGPVAFDTDLMGTPLSVRLAELDTDPEGVHMGLTISTDGTPAGALPEVAPFPATLADGRPYSFGLGLHEGLFNTLMDDLLGDFLDFDFQLTGDMADLMGGGIAALPGGDQIPEDNEGYCIGLHAGDARVARFAEGVGDPLVQVWMPDLQVDLELIEDGSCTPWLSSAMFAIVELSLDGTELAADLEIREAYVLDYRAEGVDDEEVGASLGAIIEGLAGLLMGQLSFDLGDVLGGANLGLGLNPTLDAVEPLDDSGMYGLYATFHPAE